ncbi:MAG: carboxypeptidase M32 [Planctomycetes bacterium]|nr:carboxypeptidase M32 [Planctomycetota bacterium]
MIATAKSTLDELCAFVRETAMLESIQSLLEWDERTKMPVQAGEYRAEQITYLSGMIHQRRTDPRIEQWLDELVASPLADDPHSDIGTTARQLRRDYDRRTRLPQSLVEALTRQSVLGQQAWVKAREENNFRAFRPCLEEMIRLKKEQAAAIGFCSQPYDALLDEYEPGESTERVAAILAGLREQLSPLVAEVVATGKQAPIEILRREYPTSKQEAFGQAVAARIGFSFERGRLDVTHHPFCSGMGPHDCRITTRYDAHFFPSAFFGILHEAGHGIYDQGLRSEQYGLPPGSYVSLGIHESQSRLWENFVGRNYSFWRYFFPQAQAAFPSALAGVRLEEFYFAINQVQPSLIRVEADEATYNLHIIVRFELEQALIRGDLVVADLPAAWREKYREYLGIEPADDADGVLQDIHWSAGLFGYFPTYLLGNLYAAQFYDAADRQLGGLEGLFAQGEFEPLLLWLRHNIHQQGQCYSPGELALRVSGQPLAPTALMGHLRRKLAPLYGIRCG